MLIAERSAHVRPVQAALAGPGLPSGCCQAEHHLANAEDASCQHGHLRNVEVEELSVLVLAKLVLVPVVSEVVPPEVAVPVEAYLSSALCRPVNKLDDCGVFSVIHTSRLRAVRATNKCLSIQGSCLDLDIAVSIQEGASLMTSCTRSMNWLITVEGVEAG